MWDNHTLTHTHTYSHKHTLSLLSRTSPLSQPPSFPLQDAPTKALGEVNVWDNSAPYDQPWTKTPASVVDDPNDTKDGTEQNVLMDYKFPNY